jgi:hypothetical protein
MISPQCITENMQKGKKNRDFRTNQLITVNIKWCKNIPNMEQMMPYNLKANASLRSRQANLQNQPKSNLTTGNPTSTVKIKKAQ